MSTDAVALARPLSDALHDALDACAALRARVADALERPRATRGALEMTPANLDFGRMKRGDGATLYARCARVRQRVRGRRLRVRSSDDDAESSVLRAGEGAGTRDASRRRRRAAARAVGRRGDDDDGDGGGDDTSGV